MTDELAAGPARPVPPSPRPRRAVLLSLFIGFAVFAYVLDQMTKIWVTSTMVEGERIPVFPPLLHWYFIRNSGAAFSIGENVTWVFSIIMAAVAVASCSKSASWAQNGGPSPSDCCSAALWAT